MRKSLNQILKETYKKYHLRFCMEGMTGDLRASITHDFMKQAVEYPEREVVEWLRARGLSPAPKPSQTITGPGRAFGETREFNADGTYTKLVPGYGRIKFGEPVH